MESIRAIQHRDANGDIISMENITPTGQSTVTDIKAADPDRSNPTRPRFERPLDTIRSFEAAINGAYDKRPFSRAGIKNLHPVFKIQNGGNLLQLQNLKTYLLKIAGIAIIKVRYLCRPVSH